MTARPRHGRRGWVLAMVLAPLRLLVGLGLALASLLAGVLVVVLAPPPDLLRDTALPLARTLLRHPNLHIGHLRLLPASRLELRDLWLGPPQGYRRPLFTLRRLVVAYDLGRLPWLQVTVHGVELDRPIIQLETRGGKLNWVAFLEGLPKSEEKPEEPDTGPSAFRVVLDRLAIDGLSAAMDDGQQQALLDSLSLHVNGHYSAADSDLRVRLSLEPRASGRPSVVLSRKGSQDILARLDARLGVEARVTQVHKPRLDVKLKADVASLTLRAGAELDPVRVALNLRASADLGADRAEVKSLGLRFNGADILDLAGSMDALSGEKRFLLLLRFLRLPLDRLAPYLRGALPGIEVGGTVQLSDLRASGAVRDFETMGQGTLRLPQVQGRVRLSGVRARIRRPGMTADLRGLGLDLAMLANAGFQGAPTPEALLARLASPEALPEPGRLGNQPLAAQGHLRLDAFSGFGVRLHGLRLDLSTAAALVGLEPGPLAARLWLRAPEIRTDHPGTGPLKLSLDTRAALSGDLAAERLSLHQLDLRLSDEIRLSASARLDGWGRRSLSATLALAPLDLERLLDLLPSRLRASLGPARLRGNLALTLKADGKLPGPGTPLLALPLRVESQLALTGVAFKDPRSGLELDGLSWTLHAGGAPDDLRLTSALSVAMARKTDMGLHLSDLRFPLEARLTGTQTSAGLALQVGRVSLADSGVDGHGLRLDAQIRAALPLARLANGGAASLGSSTVTAALDLDRLVVASPGRTLRVSGEHTQFRLDYDPAGKGRSVIRQETRVARVTQPEQGLLVKDLALSFEDQVSGHGPLQLPRGHLSLAGLDSDHQLSLSAGSVAVAGLSLHAIKLSMQGLVRGFDLPMPGRELAMALAENHLRVDLGRLHGTLPALRQPIRGSTFEADIRFERLKDVQLRTLSLKVPDRGLTFTASGQARGILPFFTEALPPFDITLELGLDNPRQRGLAAGRLLLPGVSSHGTFSVQVGLSQARQRLEIAGQLFARDFHLTRRQPGPEGRVSTLTLVDLDAHIPFAQSMDLVGPSGWTLPRPRRILDEMASASPLYPALKPYTRRSTGLTLGQIRIEEQGLKRTRRLDLSRVHLDLTLAENAVLLKRLYLKLFGGDIEGALRAQLISLFPLDLAVELRTQVTGVRLSYLDPEAVQPDPDTEVSALLDLSFRPARDRLEGRVHITRLSLKMLDALLAYLDPDRMNVSIQSNRRLLGAWYMKWINPRVKLVSLWISHGNLNMDIELDAWFVVGTLVQRMLKNMRIRRVNILPFLEQSVAPALKGIEDAFDPSKIRHKRKINNREEKGESVGPGSPPAADKPNVSGKIVDMGDSNESKKSGQATTSDETGTSGMTGK